MSEIATDTIDRPKLTNIFVPRYYGEDEWDADFVQFDTRGLTPSACFWFVPGTWRVDA